MHLWEQLQLKNTEELKMKFEIVEEDYQKKIAQDIKENDIIFFLERFFHLLIQLTLPRKHD